MLVYLSVTLLSLATSIPLQKTQGEIPTFTGVDWIGFEKGCYDTKTRNFVLIGHNFFIENDCGICTCDRHGFWCVPNCSLYEFDLTNCVKMYTYEDKCCPRTECLEYGPSTETETSPYGGSVDTLPTEFTEDWWSTETEVIVTNESTTSATSSTEWKEETDAYEYERQSPARHSDVWTTSEPSTDSTSSWYGMMASSDGSTTESYLVWLYREVHGKNWNSDLSEINDDFW